MAIPRIIHQTWKTATIPRKWRRIQKHNRSLHPDFEYRLWTDDEIDVFVKDKFPVIYPSFKGYQYNILRADVIRYLLMHEMGGLYLDLDYELLVPFDVTQAAVVLPKERSIAFGDPYDGIGNAFFASEPRHPFWRDVIEDLIHHPPHVKDEYQTAEVTGPGLLTRIYYSKPYPDIYVPERILYHPPSPGSGKTYKAILKNGKSLGIHHGWGSWKERFTVKYMKRKALKILRSGEAKN